MLFSSQKFTQNLQKAKKKEIARKMIEKQKKTNFSA